MSGLSAMVGGSTSVGNVRGTIELDISQLEAAARAARSLGQVFENALGGIDRSAKQTRSSFEGIVAGLTSLRGELLALSAGAGVLTNMGLTGARNLRSYRIAFQQFVSTQEESEKLVGRLIDQANKYGLAWQDVLQVSRAVVPSLKEGVKDLEKIPGIAARLRTLFPNAPGNSATTAINEFLNGQTISLQRRFNIPADLIREAAAQFSDELDQLNYILDKRGATEEGALAMADAFVGVRNELSLLLSEGFTPLFQQLQPILASFREWVSTVRESQPEIATFGSGMIAATAAGAPLLLLLNQMISAAQKLKALGVLGLLGRGGLVAGLVAATPYASTALNRAYGRATGNEALQNTTPADTIKVWREMVSRIGEYLLEGAKYLNIAFIKAAQTLFSAVAYINEYMGAFLQSVGRSLPVGGQSFMNAGNWLMERAQTNRTVNTELDKRLDRLVRGFETMEKGWRGIFTAGGGLDRQIDNFFGGGVGGAGGITPTDIIQQWATSVQRIEREAAEARLDATRQYEQQRTEAIADHERSIARDQEDFERSRLRAAEQLNRQIGDVAAESAKRQAREAADYAERVADLRKDTNERLQELEEDYQRSREQAAEDHRDRLLTAAARLDAVAVREEQKRYANQQQDAADNYTEQRSRAQEALDERLQDELKNYEKRRQEGLAADAERIQDLRNNLAEQQRLEDEDRTIRLQRQSDDFQRQLQQQATAQADRLAQIDRQTAAERAALDEAFLAQLAEAGKYTQGWLNMQSERQRASLELFDAWWDEVNKRFALPGPVTENEAWPNHFAAGGWVERSGRATVHAGELVLPASLAQALRQSSPPAMPLQSGQRGNTNTGKSSTLNIHEGAFQFKIAPGMSPHDIRRVVHSELITLLESVN